MSFEILEYTANSDAIGALRILEAIKFHNLQKKTKYYQAGTSEMFGKVKQSPQNEKTEFNPVSPYGVSKCLLIILQLIIESLQYLCLQWYIV